MTCSHNKGEMTFLTREYILKKIVVCNISNNLFRHS